jgi:acetate kinase
MSAARGQRVLVLNAGSSSLKFALFEGLERALHGQVEGIGAQPQFVCGELREKLPASTRHDAALERILALMRERGTGTGDLAACGHRVVHAGTAFLAPTLIDAQRLAAINELRALAPLHNGFGLDAIEAMRRAAPELPQVVCFDTTFHATIPEVAVRFAIPGPLHAAGYRRFGFHGLNYEHVTATLAERYGASATARLLIFHLGNGSSICAVRNGRSTATTMGYSTLDGLDMGTRCGAIDPGVLIALQRREGFSLDSLENLLYRQSGLLALSGRSSDMREIERLDEESCRFALEHFCYWAARHAGSLAVALGGVDSVAFTGGIGCGSARVRAGIAAHLGWLGVELAPERNARHAAAIAVAGSRCAVWVIAADEERAILRHVHALLAGSGQASRPRL